MWVIISTLNTMVPTLLYFYPQNGWWSTDTFEASALSYNFLLHTCVWWPVLWNSYRHKIFGGRVSVAYILITALTATYAGFLIEPFLIYLFIKALYARDGGQSTGKDALHLFIYSVVSIPSQYLAFTYLDELEFWVQSYVPDEGEPIFCRERQENFCDPNDWSCTEFNSQKMFDLADPAIDWDTVPYCEDVTTRDSFRKRIQTYIRQF